MNSLCSEDLDNDGTIIFVLDPLDADDLATLQKSLKELLK